MLKVINKSPKSVPLLFLTLEEKCEIVVKSKRRKSFQVSERTETTKTTRFISSEATGYRKGGLDH